MNIYEHFLTKNGCYGASIIVPKGIIVHSTGANNKYLRRYIQPDDGRLGVNKYKNDWNRPGVDKCVHAMIGLDKDDNICTYQLLPWQNCAWGVGRGPKGSYNYSPTGYIQFEILEDDLKDINYFMKAFTEAVHLCAYLCKLYNLPVNRVISHHEAHLEGYASGHADCDHWLKKFNKSMDWFRNMVEIELHKDDLTFLIPEPEPVKKEWTEALPGEGLSRIAKRSGITLAEIKALNPNIVPPLYIVRKGQKVRIK